MGRSSNLAWVLPGKLSSHYIGEDGNRAVPIMIHHTRWHNDVRADLPGGDAGAWIKRLVDRNSL